MAEKQRPSWWPEWEPHKFPPFAFHAEVWDAATETAVKVVIEQIEAMADKYPDYPEQDFVDLTLPILAWKQLKREAGLE